MRRSTDVVEEYLCQENEEAIARLKAHLGAARVHIEGTVARSLTAAPSTTLGAAAAAGFVGHRVTSPAASQSCCNTKTSWFSRGLRLVTLTRLFG